MAGHDHHPRACDAVCRAAGKRDAGGTYSQKTYSYNQIGNLTNNGYGTLTYGSSAHKHAVTTWNGNSYGYNANGNQTTRTIGGSTSTLTYDAENRLTTVSGAASASFKYDSSLS